MHRITRRDLLKSGANATLALGASQLITGCGGFTPPGVKTEEWVDQSCVAHLSIPFGIGTHARRRTGNSFRFPETVSRTGVTQEGWFTKSD